ncbi:Phosphopantetheine attachment site, partial [Pedobacter steynii]
VSLNSIRHFKENDNDEAQLAKCLGQLWSHGIVPDWSAYHTGERRKRISLPTYSFEPIAYPTEVNPFELFLKQNNYVHKRSAKVNDWFFRPQWKQSIRLPKGLPDLKNKTVVLFSDHPDLTNKIRDNFIAQHATCVTVSIGAGFEKRGLDVYAINPAVHHHYEMLFAALKDDGLIPSNIVHFLNVDRNDSLVATSENINFYQKAGYESLLEIVRKFTSLFGSTPLQLDVVANGWYSVTGNEMICPAKAPSLGAVKVIPSEFLNITCSAIDVVDYSEASLKSLFSELVYPSDNTEVAIRGKYRYLKGFEKISVEPVDRPVFRIKGTYLITGANGGMSSVFSNYLVDEFQSNLILTGRGEPRTDLIRTLEKKGAKVIYIPSDVTDFNTMALEIEKAEQLLGSINGVIHTAGMGDYAGVILNRSHADDQKICAPKLWGTQVLVSIFRNKKLDFFVNCSSISASLAPFGQVAYVASNLYQDAVAEADRFDFPVLSIEWTAMQEIGMAIHATRHLSPGDQASALKTGISPKDAVQILASAIGIRLPVQIISTSDFEQIFNERQDLKMEGMESGLAVPAQNRPDISTAFVAAETDTEKKLLYIYEKFFGIKQIGIEDNFFELGGDSLKAMVLLKKISQELNVNLTLKVFFEHPTIKKMALDIDEIKFLLEKKNTGQVKTIKI